MVNYLSGAACVKIRGLRVVRGNREVLRNLDAEIPKGVITGLIGPSGSGKTTFLRSIAGLQTVTSGTITVLGEPAGAKALRQKIGYATQAPAVYTDLTVRENLWYFAKVQRVPPSQIEQVLSAVNMTSVAGQLAGHLSGGQLARVSLSIALLGDRELVLLDEPTVGLDPVLRQSLWELFRQLAKQGTTLVISSHVMDEAERCDRLILFRDGAVIADETPASLRARTSSDTVEEAFLRLVEEKEPSRS
jgi:ABC-2 type transport system ATP-binding protein